MKPLSPELASRLQDWGQIDFHPDPQLNLQFNRYCVDADLIDTMHQVAARVRNTQDWHREMGTLAETAAAAGNSYRVLRLTEASQFYLAPEIDRSDYLATPDQTVSVAMMPAVRWAWAQDCMIIAAMPNRTASRSHTLTRFNSDFDCGNVVPR